MSEADPLKVTRMASAEVSGGIDVEALYRLEAPRLARYFRRRLRSENDARDWVQETFLRFAQAASIGRSRNPKAYLQRIARNLLVDNWRRNKVSALEIVELESDDPGVDPDQSFAIEVNDLMRQYRQALSELTVKTRVVFLLHRIDELTYNEIAARLEISINTVEYHMARAMSHLDRALGPR